MTDWGKWIQDAIADTVLALVGIQKALERIADAIERAEADDA